MRAGNWWRLLDSDDIWFPTYLAEQVALLERYHRDRHPDANAFNLGASLDGELLLSVPKEPQVRAICPC
jgi:hypothetical protein